MILSCGRLRDCVLSACQTGVLGVDEESKRITSPVTLARAQDRLQSEESRMHKKKFECELLLVLLVFDNLQKLPVVKFFRGGYDYSNY